MTKSRRGFQDAIVDRLYLRVGGGSTDIEWGRRQGTHWRLQCIL